VSVPLLVIGFGNELRGDDAVGPQVARMVAAWGRPGIEAIAVHQLTPELAERLHTAQRVVFVDAILAPGNREMRMRAIVAREDSSSFGHVCDPSWLLGLTELVYGTVPMAWLITIPAPRLAYGEALSPTAVHGMETALRLLGEMGDALTRDSARVNHL
jgi:hydrogenase maturation protease